MLDGRFCVASIQHQYNEFSKPRRLFSKCDSRMRRLNCILGGPVGDIQAKFVMSPE